MAVLRYYLNYENDEDLARGLLILFMPFRDEMVEIHSKDVKKVLFDSRNMVERNRSKFEKYKTMTDLISTIQSDIEANEKNIDCEEDTSDELETTQLEDIDEFNKWAKGQASKDLSKFKNLTSVCDVNQLRLKISSLNTQQRRLFDDFTEHASIDVNENQSASSFLQMLALGKAIPFN